MANNLISKTAGILTAALVSLTAAGAGNSSAIPRPEYPRPQFERQEWINLNGQWSYTFDFSRSGMDRELFRSEGFDASITVPFAPQSELSGVGYTDFIPEMWYHRTLDIPSEWAGDRIILHFGAVDYIASVYIDGRIAGRHWGGSSSFAIDITRLVTAGKTHNLVVRVEDDERSGEYAKGKQSERHDSYGCLYTRTTGIWQTVWMEAVPKTGLKDVYIVPDLDQKRFVFRPEYYAVEAGQQLRIRVIDNGKTVSEKTVPATAQSQAELPLKKIKTWSPETPFLYDVEYDVLSADGEVIDHVKAYAGMRKVQIIGNRIYLNDEPVYLRLVLDQGFYPDGIYTAPSDEALKKDVELSLAAGFNGARLHQKIFEPRFLYHCDRMGYLVWGEQASWGLDVSAADGLKWFLPEWMEGLERDFNHPSIVGWCPFNETWDYEGRKQDDDLLRIVYRMTKQYDTTRPCIDTSGNYHVETDIYDLHDYEQDPEVFAGHYEDFAQGGRLRDNHPSRQTPVSGIPVFISEYGGIKWDVEGSNAASWGYGNGPKTEEEFIARYQGLTDALLDNPHMFGFCYTQLYDVEQEVNGLYTYSRKPKFDMEIFRKINGRKAAIEEE